MRSKKISESSLTIRQRSSYHVRMSDPYSSQLTYRVGQIWFQRMYYNALKYIHFRIDTIYADGEHTDIVATIVESTDTGAPVGSGWTTNSWIMAREKCTLVKEPCVCDQCGRDLPWVVRWQPVVLCWQCEVG
jgi:hypothetical protein